MQKEPFHSFDVSYDEARRIQERLRRRVVLSDIVPSCDDIELVGGVDVAFIPAAPETATPPSGTGPGASMAPVRTSPETDTRKPDCNSGKATALAGIVVIDVKRRCVVETVCAVSEAPFPYVPGFLSFREGPAVLAAVRELSHLPGVMIYDGCGIAHPRGCGLATHMGILTCIPSIGCAKSLLCGTCDPPGAGKGEWTDIVYKGHVVGSCLRTRDRVKPVYVSPGNGFGIAGARSMILSLAWKYRLPEPTRLAHNLVTESRRTAARELEHEHFVRGEV